VSSARPKVLLVAEAANPEWVSIPLEGWSHSQAISKLVDAHLVTQIRNRDAVLRAGLVEKVDVTFIDSERVANKVHRLGMFVTGGKGKGWTTIMALAALGYPYFEHLVWKQFGERLRAREFDLVHRLTPLSPTVPSLLARKCKISGVPFILGPLNGGIPWPREFGFARRREKEWLSYVRGAYRWLPGYRSTLRHSAALLAGSRYTLSQFPRKYRGKSFYVPENAIDPERFSVRRTRRAGTPIRCAFLGRLVPYKGADMLIEAAMPLIKEGKLSLDIIGDGPEMQRLKEMSQGRVTFAGWVKHTEVQEYLAGCDLFTFPSIREFGGAVVLEAMAVGLAAVVVDYGGPGELATPETGYLIPLGNRAAIVARLREILEYCAANPEEVDRKGQLAMERARVKCTWEAKAREVAAIYQNVMTARNPAARVARAWGQPSPTV
jgi:glycosyltransferase involved in cell wall biosynthesis